MTFGERIVVLRKARKITQEELAEKIGVSRNMLCKYENDLAEPRLITFICLASVLDVSLDYLARGENWRKSDE